MKGFRVSSDNIESIRYDKQRRMLVIHMGNRSYPTFVEEANIIYKEWHRLLTLDARHKRVSCAQQKNLVQVGPYLMHPADPLDEEISSWYVRLGWKNPAWEDKKDWLQTPSTCTE